MSATDQRPTGWARYRALAYIFVVAVVGTVLFVGALRAAGRYAMYVPSVIHLAAWFSVVFYLAWWFVYLLFSTDPEGSGDLPDIPIVTLRTFLKYHTPRGRATSDGESLSAKAGKTIQAVGVIVGFSLLVFSITVRTLFDGTPSTRTAHILWGVLGLQILAVASFLISIDSLDSTINEFVTLDAERAHACRTRFYDRGIVCYYRGLVALVLSMFLLTMIVQPFVTVFGVFIFSVYGYNHWFGYDIAEPG